MSVQAIIFVPHCVDAVRWLDHCFVHCAVRGYEPLHVVRRWRDVIAILAGGIHVVVVAGRPDHVEGLEFVSEQRQSARPIQSQRRTGRT